MATVLRAVFQEGPLMECLLTGFVSPSGEISNKRMGSLRSLPTNISDSLRTL